MKLFIMEVYFSFKKFLVLKQKFLICYYKPDFLREK